MLKRHEELIAVISDNDQHETEEQWMTHCFEEFLKQEFQIQDYLKKRKDLEQITNHENDHSTKQNVIVSEEGNPTEP